MSIYNGENHLRKSIESILNQTYSNFEFIIVDDGSKDDSLKIIKDYSKNDKRIKILKNRHNLGLTKSLNRAIRISNGELIARQDVDDISLPSRFEKQIKFLKRHTDYAFCGCNGFRKNDREQELIKNFTFNEINKNLIGENCFIHSSILIKKCILDKYGYYNEKFRYGQDYELWCRLIYKFQLKAHNLKDKSIISNIPFDRFLKLNLNKFLIQRLNNIKTKIMYIKYTPYKFKCLISIIIKFLEIITLSHAMGFFSKILKKINF